VACAVAVLLLHIRDVTLLGTMFPLFATRSLLASAQLRAFTAGAYWRLASAGITAVAASLLALTIVGSEPLRLTALSLGLALSWATLLRLPDGAPQEDKVLPLFEWLARLRTIAGPVVVTRVSFDTRTLVRGVTLESRRAEEWRRQQAAKAIGSRVARHGGATSWIGAYQLAWFGPINRSAWVARKTGGMVMRQPVVSLYDNGAPARGTAQRKSGPAFASHSWLTGAHGRVRTHIPGSRRLLGGSSGAHRLATMSSRDRANILAAALAFAAGAPRSFDGDRWEVTALVDRGCVTAVFCRRPRSQRGNAAALGGARTCLESCTAALGEPEARVAIVDAEAPPLK